MKQEAFYSFYTMTVFQHKHLLLLNVLEKCHTFKYAYS